MHGKSMLWVAGACGALTLALPVRAPAQEAAAERLERIEITGSRLATSDVESASPIAIVTPEEIRQQGFPFLELFLNTLPQIVPEQGNRISNGASGTATLDLRGMGSQRTLVLLNGRRLPAGSTRSLAPDINQIPMALVSRVEVLTGGASAVHGPDAIAGVVNFILDDRFEGARGEVGYDFYNHRQQNVAVQQVLRDRGFEVPGDKSRDGETLSASLALGGAFANGRGHASIAFRHVESEALTQTERDYSACALGTSLAGFLMCGGSSASYPGRFWDRGRPGQVFWTVADNSGNVRPFVTADLFNFAPLNYYQRPVKRHGVNAFASYDLTASRRLYSEFGFHDDHTVAQIAPSAIFNDDFVIRYENPLLSADWRSRLVFRNPETGATATGPGTIARVRIGRRNVEGGGRQDDMRHTSFRQVIGIKGVVADHWDYDLFAQAARVVYRQTYRNDFSRTRYRRAMDVVADPATGQPVCAAALSGADPACVPYDIWRIGGVTQAALDYLQTPGFARGMTTLDMAGATVTGDLGPYGILFPGSRAGVELAFGIEARREKLELENDIAFSSFDLSGQTEPSRDIRGRIRADELFAEVRVPVRDWLRLSATYRLTDHSTARRTDTYGAGFVVEPARGVRARASFQRAIRAPNLTELFFPQFGGGYALGPQGPGDPCAGARPARLLEDCARSGVTASQYGRIEDVPPFEPYPALVGGNTGLQVEAAKSVTFGIVLLPARDLSATLDYFDIRLDDTISLFNDAAVLLGGCLDTGNPRLCERVRRDSGSGSLWLPGARIDATALNVGKTRASGADVGLSYRHRVHAGSTLTFDALGTWLRKWTQEAYAGAPSIDCAGRFGRGDPCFRALPKWRHRARLQWQSPSSWELVLTWRHIGTTRTSTPDVVPVATPELKAIDYFDLSGAWHPHKRLTLRAGVNNVADRDPRLNALSSGGFVNGNAFAQLYDVLGRHFFVALTARF